MIVGVISDTHGKLRPEVFTHFEGVAAILHAGDVGRPDILTELETIAPVTAVWGNVDGFDVVDRTSEEASLELEGRSIFVVHGHQFGSPTPRALAARYPGERIVIYGHTHVPALERIDGRLFLNPGSAGAARFGLKPSIALLELDDTGEHVRFIELQA